MARGMGTVALSFDKRIHSIFSSTLQVKYNGDVIHFALILKTCNQQSLKMVEKLFKKLDNLLYLTVKQKYRKIYINIDSGNNQLSILERSCNLINYKYNFNNEFRSKCKFNLNSNKVFVSLL